MISANLEALRAGFVSRLGPDWQERLTLVAVSKAASVEAVREAWAAGQRDFGENRAQGLALKQAALADLPIRWHFIGHLQTNKVRQVVGKVELIHSVDSTRLAEAISRECEKQATTCRLLIEVKTTDEPGKSGVPIPELPGVVAAVLGMKPLVLEGLMTMGPLAGGPEAARQSFRRLRELHLELLATPGLTYRGQTLSMGMSQDYGPALDEGSTMLRIGTSIFAP